MQALAASCEELRARTGKPPLGPAIISCTNDEHPRTIQVANLKCVLHVEISDLPYLFSLNHGISEMNGQLPDIHKTLLICWTWIITEYFHERILHEDNQRQSSYRSELAVLNKICVQLLQERKLCYWWVLINVARQQVVVNLRNATRPPSTAK
jgi:hypothetical protein